MDAVEMNRLRNKAFGLFTFFKKARQRQLEDVIRNNPEIFVQLLVEHKLNNRQQLELMDFFLGFAIPGNQLNENYRSHLELLVNNMTYTWLWPSSVSLLMTSLTKLKVFLPDATPYS